MRSTFKVLFYLKRNKQKTNGMVPLFCRITVDGKEVRFGMKCDVNPKYRDVEAGKANGRTADAVKINALVDRIQAFCFFLPFRFYVAIAFDLYYCFQFFPLCGIFNKGEIFDTGCISGFLFALDQNLLQLILLPPDKNVPFAL
jgi:hypothetical protein